MLFLFSHSFVKLLVFSRVIFLHVCMTQFLLILSSLTNVLTFNFRIRCYLSEVTGPSMMMSQKQQKRPKRDHEMTF